MPYLALAKLIRVASFNAMSRIVTLQWPNSRGLNFLFLEYRLFQSRSRRIRFSVGTILLGRALNCVLAIFERSVLDRNQVVVCLPARCRSEAAGVVVDTAGQDCVIGLGSEERDHTGPVLIASTKLRNVPACRHAVCHVDKVPDSGKAARAKTAMTNIAKGVVGRRAVTGINVELDSRRAAAA